MIKPRKFCFLTFLLFLLLPIGALASDAGREDVKAMLERECTNLDRVKLFSLIDSRFASDMATGVSPDLFKIMEGVVKRTDFDDIPEEKTAEIIGLIYDAFRKGAPLEYLDKIFDVAYVKTVTADRLAAAAFALREFSASDVPEEIYEEFVYKSLEDEWDPAATPVLTRGLIYGVERGLTPQKTALVIMLDVQSGELRKKSADQLVLDAIKLVREREPKNWKPLKPAQRELLAKQEQKKKLALLQKAAEEKKKRKEEERRIAEEKLRRLRQAGENRVEQERKTREIQTMITAYQEQIHRFQQDQAVVSEAVRQQMEAVNREKEERNRERDENREKQLAAMELDVLRFGKTSKLNKLLLISSVDRYLGTPYRYGGDSPGGIDCSAFTRRVYRDQGIELPRTAREQARVGAGLPKDYIQAGDLVFFDPSIVGNISHVGVYIDDHTFAHASSSRGVVKSSLRERYYQKRFVKANRIYSE